MYILVLTRENQGGESNTFSPLPDLSEPSMMHTLTPGAMMHTLTPGRRPAAVANAKILKVAFQWEIFKRWGSSSSLVARTALSGRGARRSRSW